MAIIKCPECGKEISDKAKSCPHCGYPIESQKTVSKNLIQYGNFSIDCGNHPKLSKHLYNVYIDKQYWKTLERNAVLSERLLYGEHKIKIVDETINSTVYKGAFSINNDYPTVCCCFNPKTNLLEDIEDAADEFANNFDTCDCDKYYQRNTTGPICPKCGGHMTMTTVTEDKHVGCGTVLLYIILAITVIGLLIIIPLALRKRNETVTYAVCDCCGYRRRVS